MCLCKRGRRCGRHLEVREHSAVLGCFGLLCPDVSAWCAGIFARWAWHLGVSGSRRGAAPLRTADCHVCVHSSAAAGCAASALLAGPPSGNGCFPAPQMPAIITGQGRLAPAMSWPPSDFCCTLLFLPAAGARRRAKPTGRACQTPATNSCPRCWAERLGRTQMATPSACGEGTLLWRRMFVQNTHAACGGCGIR